MSAQLTGPGAIPRKSEPTLNKIKQRLSAIGLLQVLESFPPVASFAFHQTKLQGKKAIKTHLGYRIQVSDNVVEESWAESWAYIIIEQCDTEPPVMVRDEGSLVTASDKKSRSYPRSASSLLSKAQRLCPPYCFLQTEPPANPRNKLCALILYYALVNGLADAATRWNTFENSLIDAIAYIEQRAEYQQWRSEQNNNITDIYQDGTLSATSEAARSDVSDGSQTPGGVVRPVGSAVSIKAGTTLEKLKDALGDERMHLLDYIPPYPVTIERHDIDDYWPFRLQLGTYGDSNVYVYMKHGPGRTDCKIMSHGSDGKMLKWWSFADLRGLQLSEPFACFMKIKQDLATRDNKVRYLAYYYLMLAENEGIIDSPRLQVTTSTMVPTFVAACRNLAEAGNDRNELDKAQRQPQANKGISTEVHRSLILKLQVLPEVLLILNETLDAGQGLQVAGGAEDRLRNVVSEDTDERQPTPLGHTPVCSVAVQPSPVYDEDSDPNIPLQTRAEDANTAPGMLQATETDGVGNEGSNSRVPSDAFRSSPSKTPADRSNADTDLLMEEAVHRVARQASNQPTQGENDELLSMPPEPGAVNPLPERTNMTPRNGPVLSISSGDIIEPPAPVSAADQLPKVAPYSVAPVGTPRVTDIIDLCSDGEDSVLVSPLKGEVDGTPDFERTRQLNFQDSDEGRLRWPARKRKLGMMQVISDDDDDEVWEEVDGNAWKRASLRQSQVKRLDSKD